MDEKTDQTPRASGKVWLIAIVALALYVPSAGPIAWFCNVLAPSKRGVLWKIGNAAYMPATYVIKKTHTENLAERYMSNFR